MFLFFSLCNSLLHILTPTFFKAIDMPMAFLPIVSTLIIVESFSYIVENGVIVEVIT